MKVSRLGVVAILIAALMSVNVMAARGGKGKPGSTSGSCAGGVGTGIPVVFGLAATELGRGQVSLQWWATTGATSYWIFRDGCTTSNVLAIVTTPYFIDASAVPGATHTYSVAPVVNSTLGPRSGDISITLSP